MDGQFKIKKGNSMSHVIRDHRCFVFLNLISPINIVGKSVTSSPPLIALNQCISVPKYGKSPAWNCVWSSSIVETGYLNLNFERDLIALSDSIQQQLFTMQRYPTVVSLVLYCELHASEHKNHKGSETRAGQVQAGYSLWITAYYNQCRAGCVGCDMSIIKKIIQEPFSFHYS